MKFAVNYSPPAARLRREGRIAVDLFKCPGWPDTIAEARAEGSVYVHFSLGAGDPSARPPDLDRIEAIARQTDTPFINVHVCPRVQQYPGLSDSDPPAAVARVRARVLSDVENFCARFGPGRVMIEMVPYGNSAEGFFRFSTEPEFIRDVCQATGCGLLLDLSHCRLTARALGLDARKFVEQMPLNLLRELHITGLGYIDEMFKDHMPMTDADWAELEWAAGRIRAGDWPTPWCVACEYGGVGEFASRSDPEVLAKQIPRMRDILFSSSR